MVLLLRVEIAQLTLSLRCHPSLGLHDLFRLVGAARGLMTLSGVEIVQVCALLPTRLIEVVHRMGSGSGTVRHTATF